ncbi:hypothetical protein [Flavobacterium sp. N1736]|uniref:hypothetical protein n=1 Tax=Flavobacterium sp. N1736 TaxID=2986823 RepID=UPI00222491F6|nr:hypothetical protein [Flavobacterium sp. N1736]
MINNINDEISYFIDGKGSDFTFKFGDKVYKPIDNSAAYISYRYLLNDDSEYSFKNPEFLINGSQSITDKTDYQIYFEKISKLCCIDYNSLINDTANYILISSPNKKLIEVLCTVFRKPEIKKEEIPPIIEIKLYTNKQDNRAPRVFGLLGNMNIIYILFYDPFHQIYNKTVVV